MLYSHAAKPQQIKIYFQSVDIHDQRNIACYRYMFYFVSIHWCNNQLFILFVLTLAAPNAYLVEGTDAICFVDPIHTRPTTATANSRTFVVVGLTGLAAVSLNKKKGWTEEVKKL